MAKRDKLYTVNKWNKPFFEEERRKRLYGLGGNPVWGLNLNQGLTRAGIGFAPEGTNAPMYIPWVNQQDSKVTNWYSHTGQQQPTGTLYDVGIGYTDKTPNLKYDVTTATSDNKPKEESKKDFLSEAYNAVTNAYNTYKRIRDTQNTANTLSNYNPTDFKNLFKHTTTTSPTTSAINLTLPNAGTIGGETLLSHIGTDAAFNNAATEAAVKAGSAKLAQQIGTHAAPGKNFFSTNLGSGLAMTAADLASDYVGGLISPELNKTTAAQIGNIIGKAGTAVGTGLMATGYGLPIGLLAMGVGKTLGALAKQFGSVKNDNGTSNYIYTLEGSNPQGSNEYLAGLMANTGYGPEATYSDGIFTDSGKYWARRQNRRVAQAYEDYQRKIRHALTNNDLMQMQRAIYNSSAMGGKLKKCNCKAMGGVLNNVALDSASPTGFNFLSNLTNMQEMKNQSNQDMGSSVGNSFMATPDMGTLFASGGPINIKKSHRGRLTELKKRTGKTEAELYNDGNPAHRKMVTFARNARKWKKAYGGFLDAANNLSEIEKTLYGSGGTLETKNKDYRNDSFFNDPTLYALGGIYQAAGSNWGNVSEINEGGTHEENPYQGVQVGVDPEGTPNLVEEGEVIWNDYVFSNRITVPKEVCKRLRIGQKKNGYTFADAAKKLLVESKERPNDPISKKGLEANMQILEDAQEEVKKKMEAEEAVEQFNSLPPEQQVAIMNQEGERAQDAVAQEQMAQEIQNLPPEQQQAIAQQMAMEQAAAQGQGMPQGQPSSEEQAMMQQQMAQQQMPQSGINPQEALAQAAAMQQQAINGSAYGGRLFAGGGPKDKQYIKGAKSHWETNERGQRVLVPNTPFENTGFGGGTFTGAGGGGSWGNNVNAGKSNEEWSIIPVTQTFNEAFSAAREQGLPYFNFNGKRYSTKIDPNATNWKEAGDKRKRVVNLVPVKKKKNGQREIGVGDKYHPVNGILAYGGYLNPYCGGGLLFAEGGMLPESTEEEQYQQGQQPTEQATGQVDAEMAKYSDEELQDMIEDYQEAESGEVKVTKGKLARLRKKAEKAERELERRHSQENEEQPQEARQEPSQEEIQAAAQAQAQQQMMEGQPQEGMPQEDMSPEQAMMMQQQMGGQQMSPEEMAAMELQQQQGGQYACGGKLYLTGGRLAMMLGYNPNTPEADFIKKELNITNWNDEINPDNPGLQKIYNSISDAKIQRLIKHGWTPFNNGTTTSGRWYEPESGDADSWTDVTKYKNQGYNKDDLKNIASRYPYGDYLLETFKDRDWKKNGNITKEEMKVAMHDAPYWSSTNDLLKDRAKKIEYINRRRNLDTEDKDTRFIKMWSEGENPIGSFTKDPTTGKYTYAINPGQETAFDNLFTSSRDDGLLGVMYDAWVPSNTNIVNYLLDENGNPTDTTLYEPEANGYERIGDAYSFYTPGAEGTFEPGINNTISYWRKKGDSATKSNGTNGEGSVDDESNYLTVGWKPKVDWTSIGLGVAPGLTGLAMQLGRGAPDMSELDKAVAAYERNTGTMVAPHLTHGLIRPAIIDPRVTENTLNARRLGTNRLLMNTGSTPSRGATILANDANTINQLGQAMINNWRENRQQEQAAAAFNRETATTNANILNNVDQFNAQMQSALAKDAAQLRYNAAKDKIAARDAYYAGLMGNLGSIFKGGYEAWRENQHKNERDLLAASGVFGETNGLIDNWLGISKVDPNTGKVVRGYNTGMYYWINPNTGKAEYLKTPTLATPPINACGGKIKKNKKRKGYTF